MKIPVHQAKEVVKDVKQSSPSKKKKRMLSEVTDELNHGDIDMDLQKSMKSELQSTNKKSSASISTTYPLLL